MFHYLIVNSNYASLKLTAAEKVTWRQNSWISSIVGLPAV